MLKIVFFASLRESLGCSEISVPLNEGVSVASVVRELILKKPEWQTILSDQGLLVAINQQMSGWQDLVNPGDELAIFPPVTGG